MTTCMERKISLFSRKETSSEGKDAIVADHCFEFASKIVSIEPIDHVATVARTKSYCSCHIHFGHVLLDPVHNVDKIVVRSTSPVFSDCIHKGLAIAC